MRGVLAQVTVAALLLEIDVGVAEIGRLQIVVIAVAFDVGLLALERPLFGRDGRRLGHGRFLLCVRTEPIPAPDGSQRPAWRGAFTAAARPPSAKTLAPTRHSRPEDDQDILFKENLARRYGRC